EEAWQVYRAMEAYAREKGDAALEADALNRLATAATVSSDPDVDVRGMLERAEALSRQAGDALTLARTLWNQGLRYRFHDPARSDEFFRRALEITRSPACLEQPNADEFRELEAFILIDLMVSRMTSGHRRKALTAGAEALQAFQRLGNRAMIADAGAGLGLMRFEAGEFDEALRLSDEGRDISTSIGNPWGISYNGWIRLAVFADRGEWTEGLTLGEALLQVSRNVPFIGIRGSLNGLMSAIWICLGDPHRAVAYAQAMREVVEGASGVELWGKWSAGVLGRARLAAGDLAGSAAVLEPHRTLPPGNGPVSQDYFHAGPAIAALDVAQEAWERGLPFATSLLERLQAERVERYTAEMCYWRARLYLGLGSLHEADADLRHAVELLTPARANALLWPARALRSEVLDRLHDGAAAAQERALAAALVGTIHSGLSEPLRRTFASQPAVAALLELTRTA
ncbi:MAG TPA: hypothetical protein VK449_11295, partial [Anaerolineales bacterium]|nr:hypothetical protein [Anaerolineales bacterium]